MMAFPVGSRPVSARRSAIWSADCTRALTEDAQSSRQHATTNSLSLRSLTVLPRKSSISLGSLQASHSASVMVFALVAARQVEQAKCEVAHSRLVLDLLRQRTALYPAVWPSSRSIDSLQWAEWITN